MKGKHNLIIYISLYTGTVHEGKKPKEFFEFSIFFGDFIFKKWLNLRHKISTILHSKKG
jgi:hypothetical protein